MATAEIPAPIHIPLPRRVRQPAQTYPTILSGILLTTAYLVIFLGMSYVVLLEGTGRFWWAGSILGLGIALRVLKAPIMHQIDKYVDNKQSVYLQEHISHFIFANTGYDPVAKEDWIDNTSLVMHPFPFLASYPPMYAFGIKDHQNKFFARAYLFANYILVTFSLSAEDVSPYSYPTSQVEDLEVPIRVPAVSRWGSGAQILPLVGTIVSYAVFTCASISMLGTGFISVDDPRKASLVLTLISIAPLLISFLLAFVFRKIYLRQESLRKWNILQSLIATLEGFHIKCPIVDSDTMSSQGILGGQGVWLPVVALDPAGEFCCIEIIPRRKTEKLVKIHSMILR